MSEYTAPAIEEVGSFHELTLQLTPKDANPPTDGFEFQGIALGLQS